MRDMPKLGVMEMLPQSTVSEELPLSTEKKQSRLLFEMMGGELVDTGTQSLPNGIRQKRVSRQP